MSGSMSLLEDARKYAMDKMKYQAQQKGANAIIAIDAESSFDGEIMQITMYGTAVYIEPVFDEND